MNERAKDITKALQEEEETQRRLNEVSDTLLKEFSRFVKEKRQDMESSFRALREIEVMELMIVALFFSYVALQVVFARRKAEVWREFLPKLLSVPLPESPMPSPKTSVMVKRRVSFRKLTLPQATSFKSQSEDGDSDAKPRSSDGSYYANNWKPFVPNKRYQAMIEGGKGSDITRRGGS